MSSPAPAERFDWKQLLVMLAAIAAVRVAGFVFGIVNVDECDFGLFGKLMLNGAVPYVDVLDNKPPLTYAFFALASLAGGDHWVMAARILCVLTILATALLLGAAARYVSGDSRQGWAAAWIAVAATLCESPAVSAELIMNLPTAAALALVALAGSRRTWWYGAAGVAAALAAMCKQQGAIVVVAIGAVLAFEAFRGEAEARSRARRGLGWFAAGVAMPWVALALTFVAAGELRAAYEWLVLRNMAQIESTSDFSAVRALAAVATCVAATLGPWLLALRGARRGAGTFHRTVLVLLVLTCLAVSVGRRFYEHYFLQFAPPLALLGAAELVAIRRRWPTLRPVWRAATVLTAVLPVVGYAGFTLWRGMADDYPSQERKTLEVAAWLADHTAPSDRVFVWGDRSTVYCESGRLPGTRYLRASFHVGDVDPEHVTAMPPGFSPSRVDVETTVADLERHRTEIVVDTAPADIHRWSLFPMRAASELDAYVQRHYRVIGHPAGAVVYRRIPTAAAEALPAPAPSPRRDVTTTSALPVDPVPLASALQAQAPWIDVAR